MVVVGIEWECESWFVLCSCFVLFFGVVFSVVCFCDGEFVQFCVVCVVVLCLVEFQDCIDLIFLCCDVFVQDLGSFLCFVCFFEVFGDVYVVVGVVFFDVCV